MLKFNTAYAANILTHDNDSNSLPLIITVLYKTLLLYYTKRYNI